LDELATLQVLWLGGPEFFSKGLVVVSGVAYFGLSRKSARFDRNTAQGELLAFELATRKLLWRRKLPHKGLVNAIEAPWDAAAAPFRRP